MPFIRKRLLRLALWTLFGCLAGSPLALRAFAAFFAQMDDPARLNGVVHLVTTNGFTLRWVEKPANPNGSLDLVFIHGSPGGAGVWESQFREPFPGARQIAYDRPGFGKSLPRLREPHLQEQVEALMAVIASATTNRVFLIRHSYGSPIALLAALEHPDRVRGALLIGGDVDPALEQPWLFQRFFGSRAISWVLPAGLRQCNREMLTAGGDLRQMEAQLPKLAAPVVMLHGDRDPLVPVANVAWMEARLAAAGKSGLFKKIILPGVNHFIPWEHPKAVREAIEELIQMAEQRERSADRG